MMEVQGMHGGKTQAATEWSTGFCDCFSDCSSCCLTFCCPCVTFGRIAAIVDRGSTSCCTDGVLYMVIAMITGCGCIYSCYYRTKMRQQFNLKGNDCGDCLKHFCCELCALTQMYRELNNRGFDVSLGWDGNVERQNAGVAMGAPVVEGGMRR